MHLTSAERTALAETQALVEQNLGLRIALDLAREEKSALLCLVDELRETFGQTALDEATARMEAKLGRNVCYTRLRDLERANDELAAEVARLQKEQLIEAP